MRALYFVDGFWPAIGGVESMSASLLPRLAERGYEFLVVTDHSDPRTSTTDHFMDIPVRRLPFIRAIRDRDLELLAEVRLAVRDLIREHRPSLIHAVFTGPSVWLLPAKADIPVIISFHGSWPMVDFGADGLLTRTLRRAAWVTACSEDSLAYLRAVAPYIADRSSVILNGLDLPTESEPPPPPDGPPLLLCAGRVVYDKGIDVAVDALAETAPQVRLLIAGDGPEIESLRRRAARLGLAGRVEFLGWVTPADMPDLISRCSAVLVPSRLEGFGLVALEAALMARPVIATRIGGLPEVVEDGVTGVLVPEDDVEATASAVRSLLSDPRSARQMGLAGRARAIERFGARRHTDEWDALYRRLTGSRTPAVAVTRGARG